MLRKNRIASKEPVRLRKLWTTMKKAALGRLFVGFAVLQSGVFLPSLYEYSVVAAFFSSPLLSKAICAVTPL